MITIGDNDKCRRGMRLSLVGLILLSLPMASATAQRLRTIDSPTPNFGIPPAANTQRALEDPPGVSDRILSGFYASLGVALGHTDNAARVPSPNEQSDTFWAFTPALGYKTNLGRHQFQIDYVGFAERYQDLAGLDSTDHRIRAAMDFDISRKLDAGVFASYSNINERRGTSGTPLLQLEPNKVEIVDFGATAAYGTRAAKAMQIKGGVSAAEWRYQNNEQENRDRDYSNAFAEVHYNPTAKTSVFLLGTYTDIDYTQPITIDRSSEETTLQVGAEWQATAKTLGRVSIGNIDKDFKDPSLKDYSGLTYAGRIRWQRKSYSGVNLYFSRRPEESSSEFDGFYITTLWGISADHAFTDRLAGYGYFNYSVDDFDTSGREDKYKDFGLGLDYTFRRWLALGGRYGRIERDSNVEINNYTENYFALTLRATYQHYQANSGRVGVAAD